MSPKGLSYRDAARVLGDESNTVLTALDKMLGGLLLGATVAGNPLAISLFEAKNEFIQLSEDLWCALADRLRGLRQYDRTERISAAHAIIVMSSYFETISELDQKWSRHEAARKGRRNKRAESNELAELEFSVATKLRAKSKRLRDTVSALLSSPIPIPVPQTLYEVTLREIGEFYADLTENMQDELMLRESTDLGIDALRQWVSEHGVRKYEANFRRLAVDFPEVAFWANMTNFQNIQNEIYNLRQEFGSLTEFKVGLLGLGITAAATSPSSSLDEKRQMLATFYKMALRRPIVESGELPAVGMTIPNLSEAYINPNFRSANVDPNDAFYTESWWNDPSREPRHDIQQFFYGYLKSPEASRKPVVVLGQPGSGKSVLTKTLAARLHPEEFFVVRVSLRDVAAEVDIQLQVEQSIYSAIGYRVNWPELARSSDSAVIVIILDGFDELLQATGVSQSDYLQRVALFQQRERDNGRPCVMIVTSRTAVADRARVPDGGIAVVRLESFDEAQIDRWLALWNDSNSVYFAARNVQPLRRDVVLARQDLASQPLLLLMLALYDAGENALKEDSKGIGHAQLYERLIVSFAQRDARKLNAGLPDEELARKVNDDVMRLSIAAAAMFNRSRQWITHDELNKDLGILMPERRDHKAPGEDGRPFAIPRTAAETLLGRFFFIQETRALVAGVSKGTFEFLHATFGEFLMARLVALELQNLNKSEAFAAEIPRHVNVGDSFMYALLSFAPLFSQGSTVEFLGELIAAMSTAEKDLLRDLAMRLFGTALDVRASNGQMMYEPAAIGLPARCGIYSANLLVLILLLSDGLLVSKLLAGSEDPVREWGRLSPLWRSQLTEGSWYWLTGAIAVTRVATQYGGDTRDLMLLRSFGYPNRSVLNISGAPDDAGEILDGDLSWYLHGASEKTGSRDDGYAGVQLLRRYRFTCDVEDATVIHALMPIFESLDFCITLIRSHSDGRTTSCANSLFRLWVLSVTGASGDDRAAAYEECIAFGLDTSGWVSDGSRRLLRDIVTRQLKADVDDLPRSWRIETHGRLQEIAESYDSPARTWIDALLASLA